MRFLVMAFLFLLLPILAFGDEVYIEQVGDNNVATIEQNGSGNFAEVWQEGNGNDADVSWFFEGCGPFCDFDTLGYLQYQDGHENEARLEIDGNNNHVSQWQEGRENVAELFIKGDGNAVKQVQLGDYNESFAEILGDYNILCHYQEGNDWSQPLISIVGSWPPICVIQK